MAFGNHAIFYANMQNSLGIFQYNCAYSAEFTGHIVMILCCDDFVMPL